MSWKRSERAVAAARALIERLGAEGPEDLDVELIAMLHGAHVEWFPLTNEDAHVRRIGEKLFIGLAERSRASKKWRFDLAHEIGHLLLHTEAEAVNCPSVALRKGEESAEERAKYWRSEREASDFSVELLHARRFFEPFLAVPPGVPFTLDEVGMIAERFDMSLTSTAIRCAELTTTIPCAVTVVKDGRISWHAVSAAFRGKIVKGRTSVARRGPGNSVERGWGAGGRRGGRGRVGESGGAGDAGAVGQKGRCGDDVALASGDLRRTEAPPFCAALS